MNENGWENYSRVVLQQLETLSSGIEGLRIELQDVKNQLTELKVKEDRVQEIKEWKNKLEEIASTTQLQTALKYIQELKLFKTKAITGFAVIQAMMAISLGLIKYF